MRILLLGEYSNVHATLAKALREEGHDVVVASNGDFWKDYPRDIDLRRPNLRGMHLLEGAALAAKIGVLLPRLRGYDIVQFINPLFVELRAERLFSLFRYLRAHNRALVLGAYGIDYYWVHENITALPLRYSDFNIGTTLRDDAAATTLIADWVGTAKERLTRYCAANVDHIVSCLYEYDVCYRRPYPTKTTFIPLPIIPDSAPPRAAGEKVQVLIGISKGRSAYKGTDIMLAAAQDVARRYPSLMTLTVVEGLPFREYTALLRESDVLLDQLYSYTPAMNALQAMAYGVVVVGGGEEENYAILGEETLRPIINVTPSYASVYSALEDLITHRARLPLLKAQSKEYISRHHDYRRVAQQYLALYATLSPSETTR